MTKIQRDFSTVDRKARMRLPFVGLSVRPVAERVKDFEEVMLPLDFEWAKSEAARCIHCPDPAPCYKACPAHIDISYAMWLIEHGEFLQAAQLYRQTSTMPEICGRVCPHEQLCQGACVRNKRNEPVLIGPLEYLVADYERQEERVPLLVGESTGTKVAVIGAGPAGLSCAEGLVQRGHWVTIFEAKPAPGGLLTYGIPNFKLAKSVVFALCQDLKQAGVEFIFNTYIGRQKTVNDLFHDGFDAVFVGTGTGVDVPMDAPGEDLPGVHLASDFLMHVNTDPTLLPPELRGKPEVGRKVVVIGGDDTASDCLRTAIRSGAKEVICFFWCTEKEMPGGIHYRQLARAEGAHYEFLVQILQFIAGADGRLAEIECIRTRLGEPDAAGHARPIPIEGSNFIVPADTAILSLGYRPDPIIGATTPGLKTHKWGLIVHDQDTGATSRMGVFVGGDIASGPSLVVTAMVAGRKAAATIDAYLY